MILQKHASFTLFDARPVINVNRVKEDRMIHKIKELTRANRVNLIRENHETLFGDDFEHISYHGVLCCKQEDFSGGLFCFKNVINKNVIRLDLSTGFLVVFDPKIYTVKKYRIDYRTKDTHRDIMNLYF